MRGTMGTVVRERSVQCAVCSANTHRAGNPRTAGAEALEGTTNYQLLKGIRGCNLHTKPQPLCQ